MSKARDVTQKKREEKMKKKTNYEYLEQLSLEKAKEEEETLLKEWQNSEKRRLEEKLQRLIVKAQRDFEEEFYGSEEKADIQTKISALDSAADEQNRKKEAEFRLRKEEHEAERAKAAAERAHNRRMLRIEHEQEQQAESIPVVAPLEEAGDIDDISSLGAGSEMGSMGSMGSAISYRMINEQSKGPLSRILKRLKKLQNTNGGNGGNTNYRFSKDSDASIVSMSTMSQSDAKLMYIDEKFKQRYGTKFKHQANSAPTKVVITRQDMTRALKGRKERIKLQPVLAAINSPKKGDEQGDGEEGDAKAKKDSAYLLAYKMKIMNLSSEK